MSERSHQPAPTVRPLWTLIGPGLGAMLAAYQLGLLFVLHNTVQREFGLSFAMAAVAIIAHLAGLAGGFAPGFLLAHRAPTSMVAPAIVLMLFGAILTALSGSPALLMFAELLAGLGGGAALGAAAGLARHVGDARRGPVRLGLGLAVLGGLLFGLLLGLLVMTMLSWRLPHLLAIPLALIALIATAAAGVVAMTRGTPVNDRRA